MAQVTIPRWSLYAGVIVLVAALAFSLGGIYTARGDNHDTVFYGCLFAGALSQVNTDGPLVNCGRGMPVQWSAVGPAGEPGLPGEPGVSGWQLLLSEPVTVAPGDVSEIVFGFCPAGKVVLGGGVISSSSPFFASEAARVISSAPSFDGEGWFGRVINDGDTEFNILVRYVCAFVDVEEEP